MTKTFSEILDEQLNRNLSVNSGESASSFYSSNVEYAHFSQIRFTGSTLFPLTSPANSRSKYRPQARAGVTQPLVEIPVEYILENHQKTSLNYLNERLSPSERLIGQFSNLQLKTAFRRIAKVCHPDVGGTPESFRELITHFKVMSLFLITLK